MPRIKSEDILAIAAMLTENPDVLVEAACQACGAPATMFGQKFCTNCGQDMAPDMAAKPVQAPAAAPVAPAAPAAAAVPAVPQAPVPAVPQAAVPQAPVPAVPAVPAVPQAPVAEPVRSPQDTLIAVLKAIARDPDPKALTQKVMTYFQQKGQLPKSRPAQPVAQPAQPGA